MDIFWGAIFKPTTRTFSFSVCFCTIEMQHCPRAHGPFQSQHTEISQAFVLVSCHPRSLLFKKTPLPLPSSVSEIFLQGLDVSLQALSPFSTVYSSKRTRLPSRLTLAGCRAQPRGLVWVIGVSQERCELRSDRKRLSNRKTKRHSSNVLAYLSLKVLENKPTWMAFTQDGRIGTKTGR